MKNHFEPKKPKLCFENVEMGHFDNFETFLLKKFSTSESHWNWPAPEKCFDFNKTTFSDKNISLEISQPAVA